MSKRPTKRMHREMFSAELNLMPIMNLFMVLIPFLLLTAIFVKTATIDIHLPQEVKSSQGGAKIKSSGPVIIKATKSGFAFDGIGKGLTVVRKSGGGFNYKKLSSTLAELKKKYPRDVEAIVLMPKDLSYEKVIKIMDAVRETDTTKLFPVISLGAL